MQAELRALTSTLTLHQLARTLQSAQMVDLVQIWYSVRPGGHLLHPRAGEQAVPLHPLLTKEL